MSWAMVAIGGASLAGGLLSAKGAGDAADAAAAGNAQAIAEQRRQFDTLLGLTAPQREVGNQALNALASAFIPGYTGMSMAGPTAAGFSNVTGAVPGKSFGVKNLLSGTSGGMGALGGLGVPVSGDAAKGFAVGGALGGILGGAGAFDRVKSKNRPIAQADLDRLLQTVRDNPTAYDTQAEVQALINRNRPGARSQILNALAENQVGYFTPPPPMQALTADDLAQQFYRTPGNQFALDETLNVIGNSFAARGGALGGNALRALSERIPNLLMDRTFGQLNVLAGFGNQATGLAGQGAINTGANVSNLLAQTGADRGSGILGQYAGVGSALQGGLQQWLEYRRLQQLGGR